MRLSPHFRESEMACPCCGVWQAHPLLVWCLEELRARIGRPLIVNSGYRCPAHNATVGGHGESLHMSGRAADVRAAGMTGDELLAAAQGIPYIVGFGVGRRYLHVDIGPGARRVWRY